MKTTKLKKGVEISHQEAPAFTTKYLAEEKEETDSEVLTIRINKQEREIIDYIKNTLHYSQDAKAIKAGLPVLRNVIQSTFGTALMQKLCAENRRRAIIEPAKETENK